jgi:hypothetical protein
MGTCRAWGPSRDVGGTTPVSSIALNFIVGRNSNVDV